jgi:hypothetical protein
MLPDLECGNYKEGYQLALPSSNLLLSQSDKRAGFYGGGGNRVGGRRCLSGALKWPSKRRVMEYAILPGL